jgi:hypothetical protein
MQRLLSAFEVRHFGPNSGDDLEIETKVGCIPCRGSAERDCGSFDTIDANAAGKISPNSPDGFAEEGEAALGSNIAVCLTS